MSVERALSTNRSGAHAWGSFVGVKRRPALRTPPQQPAAPFRAGAGGYGLWVNADWSGFRNKWQQWSGQGLRLTDLEVVRSGGQTRYSGVFVAGSGGHAPWAVADWPSFRSKWEELSNQGLVDFAVRPTGIEIAAAEVAQLLSPDADDGSGTGFSAVGGVTLAGTAAEPSNDGGSASSGSVTPSKRRSAG